MDPGWTGLQCGACFLSVDENFLLPRGPFSGCVSSLQQSDYPYNENVPSIKIPMDLMEQEPFLGSKASDSE